MDLTNLKSVLVVLHAADNAANDQLKNSSVFQNVIKSGSNLTELDLNGLMNESLVNTDQYDAVVAVEQEFSTEQLERIFKLLKPSAKFLVKKQQSENAVKNLTFMIKVAGFIIHEDSGDMIMSTKPNYELGSSVKIDLGGEKKGKKKVWALEDDDVMDVDLINDDELLDEADKVKPSAEELRVCATTKERKACANCSCGLKEELESEEIAKIRENSQNTKSSCGSCYLGDAFRCASCPYKGLPAFKPGEKIVIDNTNDL